MYTIDGGTARIDKVRLSDSAGIIVADSTVDHHQHSQHVSADLNISLHVLGRCVEVHKLFGVVSMGTHFPSPKFPWSAASDPNAPVYALSSSPACPFDKGLLAHLGVSDTHHPAFPRLSDKLACLAGCGLLMLAACAWDKQVRSELAHLGPEVTPCLRIALAMI